MSSHDDRNNENVPLEATHTAGFELMEQPLGFCPFVECACPFLEKSGSGQRELGQALKWICRWLLTISSFSIAYRSILVAHSLDCTLPGRVPRPRLGWSRCPTFPETLHYFRWPGWGCCIRLPLQTPALPGGLQKRIYFRRTFCWGWLASACGGDLDWHSGFWMEWCRSRDLGNQSLASPKTSPAGVTRPCLHFCMVCVYAWNCIQQAEQDCFPCSPFFLPFWCQQLCLVWSVSRMSPRVESASSG